MILLYDPAVVCSKREMRRSPDWVHGYVVYVVCCVTGVVDVSHLAQPSPTQKKQLIAAASEYYSILDRKIRTNKPEGAPSHLLITTDRCSSMLKKKNATRTAARIQYILRVIVNHVVPSTTAFCCCSATAVYVPR